MYVHLCKQKGGRSATSARRSGLGHVLAVAAPGAPAQAHERQHRGADREHQHEDAHGGLVVLLEECAVDRRAGGQQPGRPGRQLQVSCEQSQHTSRRTSRARPRHTAGPKNNIPAVRRFGKAAAVTCSPRCPSKRHTLSRCTPRRTPRWQQSPGAGPWPPELGRAQLAQRLPGRLMSFTAETQII